MQQCLVHLESTRGLHSVIAEHNVWTLTRGKPQGVAPKINLEMSLQIFTLLGPEMCAG